MATTEAVETREAQLFIGGEWVDGAGGATFDDHDPFTGEVVARVAAGGRDEARRAVDAAAEAFPAWSQTPPAERQRIFLKAADVLRARLVADALPISSATRRARRTSPRG